MNPSLPKQLEVIPTKLTIYPLLASVPEKEGGKFMVSAQMDVEMAEAIAHRWNHHPQLVQALEQLLNSGRIVNGVWEPFPVDAIATARTALKAAKGEA